MRMTTPIASHAAPPGEPGTTPRHLPRGPCTWAETLAGPRPSFPRGLPQAGMALLLLAMALGGVVRDDYSGLSGLTLAAVAVALYAWPMLNRSAAPARRR